MHHPFPNSPRVDAAVAQAFMGYLRLEQQAFSLAHINLAHQRFVSYTENPEEVRQERNKFGNDALREAIWPAVLHMLNMREGQNVASQFLAPTPGRNKKVFIPGIGMGLDSSFIPNPLKDGIELIPSDLQPSGPPVHLQRCFNWLGIDTKVLFLRGQGAVFDVFDRCMKLRAADMNYLFDVPYDVNSQALFVNPNLSPPFERRFIPLVHPMADVALAEYRDAFGALLAGVGEGQGVVIATARVPVGSPDDYMTEFLEIGRRANFFTVVDVKLEHLVKKERCLALLEKGANFFKCDNKEFLLYLKHGLGESYEESRLENPSDVKCLALRLMQSFPKIDLMVISLGAKGAVFVAKHGKAWYADALKVPVVSEVGCGDSALAYALKTLDDCGGIDLILSHRIQEADNAIAETLKAFVLEGAATAMKAGADLGTPDDVRALQTQSKATVTLVN